MNNKMQKNTSMFLIILLLATCIQMPNINVFAVSTLSSFTVTQVSKAIVMNVGSSSALVNNVKKSIDTNDITIKPVIKNGTTFVPVRFVSENLGATVIWDQKSNTATIALGAKTIKAVVGQSKVKINNVYSSIPAATFKQGSRVYVPLRVIAEAFGKNVFYNNGIIIISSTKPVLDQAKEQQLVNDLTTWFSTTNLTELSIRQIVDHYDDSVVTILVNDYYGENIAQGSGFYIGNGLFITNNHVLSTGYSYDLLLNDGQLIEAAGVVKYDKTKDLAVLKAKQIPNLKPVKIGSKTMLQKGDRIVAIGSPMGLSNTVSDGLVSSFRQDEFGIDFIQITAPITHGSSGSPLFNIYGYVVGVNTLGYDGSGNLNFAVTIDSASAWIKELLPKSFSTIPFIKQSDYLAQGGTTPEWRVMTQVPILK